ncbi:MAG: EAL domain-containing protein [Atopobiaceae bacterium]|nr:EAL domain-containing protein [Atopobiaceae bacterium]
MPVFNRGAQMGTTGLVEREKFMAQARKTLKKYPDEELCVVYARLLNLDAYNLRHDAESGEKVVTMVTSGLRKKLPAHNVGMFDANGFAAIAPIGKVERTLNAINYTLPSSGEPDGLILKAGCCVLRDGLTIEEAMRRARYALEDIQLGSFAYTRLFDLGLETVYIRRRYVVEHLDDAIARGEIRAYAQPIVRVLTGMISEVEILARWESEQFGFLRPDEFVPELERHQLIHRLDAEVIRLACKQWAEASKCGINVPFGINLSRLDFELCDMYEVVREAMRTYDVPVGQVHIEITESALAHSNDVLMRGIEKFRDAGFQLYLDDFGSGYSSLEVLEGTSFDVVKVDMSLLREIESNERARVIVADAVSMVKRLNLQTLCEGVETEEQYMFLKAVGCEKAQGYFFSKPMRHEEIMAHLEETASLHETGEEKRYFDSLGKVNLMDGTRASVNGVEAAHFQGSQPFALIEIRGQSIVALSSNTAFNQFAFETGSGNFEGFISRLSDDLKSIHNQMLHSASKAKRTHAYQQMDFVLEGNICTMGLSHVESSENREAYLLEMLSVTKYSRFNDFKLLEESLRFLYSIFKRIDLLDVTDNTWRNIYLNVPRYDSLRAGETPRDEIEAFCSTFIHPDDRARFLEFYDLETVDERIRKLPTDHVADTFFAISDNNRYVDQLFMIIPASIGGHKQYLSCLRELDIVGIARQTAGSWGRISDEVLLSGILDVTERYVFWKDAQRRFVGANQRFLDYYGFESLEELAGKTDVDLGWTHNASFDLDERRVLEGERVLEAQGYTEAKGELRSIWLSKMPLWSQGKVIGLVGFLVDKGPWVAPDVGAAVGGAGAGKRPAVEPDGVMARCCDVLGEDSTCRGEAKALSARMDVEAEELRRRICESGYKRVLLLGTVEDMRSPRLRKPIAASGIAVVVPPEAERAWIERALDAVLDEGPEGKDPERLQALVAQAAEHGARAIASLHPAVAVVAASLSLPVV